MERLVNVDALIDDVRDRYCKDCAKRKGIKNGKCRFIYKIGEAPCRACDVEDMIYELESAPTVDPVKPGHWERYLNEGLKWRCSECASRFTTPFDYCPHCGAKMDEVIE